MVVPLLVVLCAGLIRFTSLDQPSRCYFDETYYYYDARDYLAVGTETSFAVHPPVGKWLIGTGLLLFGLDDDHPLEQAVEDDPRSCVVRDDDPPSPAAREREAAEAFARRAMAAFFGTGAVAVTYFAGLRLLRRRSAAALAATLLAVDGLAITMSRIAMLDIFLQFFVVLGVLALLVDRDVMWQGAPGRYDPPPVDEDGRPQGLPDPSRRWLWVAGVAFGLAVATKWTGLAALGLGGLFALGSDLAWRRRWTGSAFTGLGVGLARGMLALIAVPVAVYLLSYVGWFTNFEDTRKADRCADGCSTIETIGAVAGGWWEEQGEIYRFHLNLEADHPYRAPASTWPLMTRPVAYYYESCPESRASDPDAEPCVVDPDNVAEVLGMGNPAIWWMALASYPFLLYYALARRRWEAGVIALLLFGQALPYLAAPRPVFLFYMTPMLPFLALGLAYAGERATEHRAMGWVPSGIAVLALAGFVLWAPLFLGFEIPREAWDRLIWIRPGWI